jgi:RNA polymerase-binding transcription factor DksA
VVKAPLAKTKPVASKAPVKTISPKAKPVSATAKPVTPQTKAIVPKVKSLPAGKTTTQKPVIAKPVIPQAKPKESLVKSTTPTPVMPSTVASKPVVKSTGSKSSDLSKPSVSSKPLVEKPKEQQIVSKEFHRTIKQSPAHAEKPFQTMLDKKEHKPLGATDEPQKSRYNDKELEEFDQLIDQKLIVAREQLEFYLKQLEDMAENPDNKIKGLDDGLSTLESERVSSMAARQQKLIQHLENAKIRIKNKVYGICRETGKLISKERLRAVPHATLSIEAKQAQN